MRKLTLPEYVAAILTLFALPVAYYVSRYNYNLFHVFADGISIIIAACVFTIAWNSRRLMDNDYFLLVGIGFFFFIFIDCLHILGNKGMNMFLQHVNLGPTFYILSRYCLAITLLAAPLFIRRRLNITAAFVVYSIGTLLLLLTIFYWHTFPETFIEGVGLTSFKIISDYVICIMLIASIGLLHVNRDLFSAGMRRIMISSIAMFAVSELTFTLYTDPFGFTNFAGHLFQIASFYLFYRAYVITGLRNPEEIMFRKLQENEERYRTTVASIGDAVIATDEKGRVTLLNRVAEELTGWKQETATGKDLREIFNIINEITRKPAENPIQKVLQEGLVAGLANHTCLISRDGRKVPIEDSAAPIRNAEGETIGVVLVFHDVTEKRKTERALAEQEERFRSIFENSLEGMFLSIPETGQIIDANPAALAVFQMTKEKLLEQGRAGVIVQTPELAEAMRLRAKDGKWQGELTFRRKDGSTFPVEVSSSLFKDSKDVTMSIMSIRDITERKRAESALRESEQRFRLALKNAPISVSIQDLNLRYIWAYNHKIARSEDMIGKFDSEIFTPGEAAYLSDIKRQVISGNVELREQMWFNRPSGRIFLDIHWEPVHDDKGNVIGVGSATIDLTPLKEAEDEIRSALDAARESESILKKGMERLDIISNTASQLLMSTEPQKIVETLCNRVMEHLDCHAFFNYLVDDAGNRLRLNAYAGIPEETAREILFLDFGVAVCGCAARDAHRIVAENIPTTPDVRTDLVRSFGIKAYAAHPLFSQGKVIGTLSFGTRSRLTFSEDDLSLMKSVTDHVAIAMERIHLLRSAEERAEELNRHVKERTGELQKAYDDLKAEVEERKRLEDQLRQSHKIEALGTLTGGIAHDFNNILAGMIGFAEMAYEDAGTNSKMKYHIERILKGGMRGRDLVKQMLTFSRKTEYDVKALAITPLIEETLKLLRATIPTTVKMEFTTTAKKDIVLGNATGIQQILMNLATNSAYAMRENGGSLTITLSDAYDEGSPFVALTVRDTGVGMPPEILNRIFEPFFTTKEAGQGTGMGLAMVYGIVKSFGGDISVHSTPGRGTVFHIYFPRASTDESTEAAESMNLPTGNENILLVDDEEMLSELGKQMLERLGYSVTATTSSAEALKIFAQDPLSFDLIITDHTMPEMTGLRFAEKLLAMRSDIPIILCSGFSESIDAESVKAAGIKEFLMKPLTKQELATAVRRVLEQTTSP